MAFNAYAFAWQKALFLTMHKTLLLHLHEVIFAQLCKVRLAARLQLCWQNLHSPEITRATPVLEHLRVYEAALVGELSAPDGFLGQRNNGV